MGTVLHESHDRAAPMDRLDSFLRLLQVGKHVLFTSPGPGACRVPEPARPFGPRPAWMATWLLRTQAAGAAPGHSAKRRPVDPGGAAAATPAAHPIGRAAGPKPQRRA